MQVLQPSPIRMRRLRVGSEYVKNTSRRIIKFIGICRLRTDSNEPSAPHRNLRLNPKYVRRESHFLTPLSLLIDCLRVCQSPKEVERGVEYAGAVDAFI